MGNKPNILRLEVRMNLETGEIGVGFPPNCKPLVCNALARAITAVIEHVEPVIKGKQLTRVPTEIIKP